MRRVPSAVAGVLIAVLVAAPAAAASLAPAAPVVERDVVPVQERLFPRLFGGDDEARDREIADMALRIEQLERQVRMLTGQVEELTFTVRRLEHALRQEGTLPPRAEAEETVPDGSGATATAQLPAETGPLDLSAINRGIAEPVSPAPSRRAAEPVTTPELETVRDLQRSGRFAMAAEEARKVLTDNPAGPVAGEARYLLGEALLAQGAYRNAANLFLENYTSDPAGMRAPASLLKLSSALNGLGERDAACSSLEEFFGAYPNVDPDLRAEAEREREAAGCT